MTNPIFIRADGSPQIGLGHLMRCLALAQALRRQGREAVFATRPADGTAAGLPDAYGFNVTKVPLELDQQSEAGFILDRMRSAGSRLIVVDHYGLGEEFRKPIVDAGMTLAALDDISDSEILTCHAVLNQNLGAESLEARYRAIAPKAQELLLGARFFMLREELAQAGEFIRFGRQERWNRIALGMQQPNLLIMMGGADTLGLTPRVTAISSQFSARFGHIYVVCGHAMPESLVKAAKLAIDPTSNISVLQSPDMAVMLARADIAITAGGSSSMEMAYCGIPALLIQTADNQKIVCDGFRRLGLTLGVMTPEAAVDGGVEQSLSGFPGCFSLLRDTSIGLMKNIDEAGAERVASRLINLLSVS